MSARRVATIVTLTRSSTMKRLPLLIALALLVLGGSAYLWLQRQGRFTESAARSSPDHGGDGPGGIAALPPAGPAGSEPQRVQLEPGASGSAPGVRTTWSAQVVLREGRRPLAGAALRIKLLSPDASTEDLVLVTGDDGAAGPIDIPFERYQAAEVSVDPGPQWAGLFSTVLFAADRANHDVFELGPSTVLSVQVVDLSRNAPLPRADVTIRDANGVVSVATTDHEGLARFRWEAAGGPFSVDAAAHGFSSVSAGELARPPSSDQEVRLLLAPAGILRVRVQDEAEQALSGCRVTATLVDGALLAQPSVGEVRIMGARWDPPVEEPGAYVFSSLPCQTVIALRAEIPDGREARGLAQVLSPPGVGEATLTVSAGLGTEVWTFDDRGEPLAGVAVGMDQEVLGTTDEIGHLTLALQDAKGGRELWARKSGYALGWQVWDPGETSMIYRLAPEKITSGTVVDSSGRPQKLVRITPLLGARDESRDARRRRGELCVSNSRERVAGTDSSGAFVLRGIGGGWIDLHVRPPKGSSFDVRDVLAGTQGLVISIPDDGALGREQGIALSVLVLDQASGAPVTGALVSAFQAPDAQSKSSKDTQSGKTKADGQARLTFALEGHYWVTAVADGYVPFSGPIVEYPVGNHVIEIELAPSAELQVSVVDGGGTGLEGYWISAQKATGAQVSFEHVERGTSSSRSEIMTGVDGQALANRMPAGRLILEVREERGRMGAALARKEIDLVPGERVEVELRVP